MMIKITPEDQEWLHREHRGVVVTPSRDVIEGVFRVRGLLRGYRMVSDYRGIPDESLLANPNFAEDKFRIRVSFSGEGLPKAQEIGGRFEACARKMRDETGKSLKECLWDLHIFANGNLCLGHGVTILVELQRNPGIRGFVERLLIPYLFFHAYWNKNGEPPWPVLSHNFQLATLEEIFHVRKDRELLKEHLSRVVQIPGLARIWGDPVGFFCWPTCFCDSGRDMRDCHPKAFKGAMILSGACRGEIP